MTAIAELLASHRFLITMEKSVQRQIADVLTAAALDFEDEVRLAKGDIIDFVVGRVGIEVKVAGSRRAILRQLERYAESDRIDSLILVGSIAMGLPPLINGKPATIVSIGRAWL